MNMILTYTMFSSFGAWVLLDAILIPWTWRVNSNYAEQRGFPKSFLDRSIPECPKWDLAILMLDPTLRVNKSIAFFFLFAALARWVAIPAALFAIFFNG